MSEKKHPAALPYLFFTEMWERFGYYLIIGIFTLYLQDPEGGFGMVKKDAYDIFGTFIALVFLTPFIGGLLADRLMGYIKPVFLGGTLMGLGYLGLMIHDLRFFYISLVLIILGNGFFKPNISSLLGNLYNDNQYKAHKDSGFNIFYMGINVGALICNLVAAWLRNKYGWSTAFMAAGLGMFSGLIVFFIGLKHYRHADILKPPSGNEMSLAKIFSFVILPAFAFGFLGWMIKGNGDIFGSNSNDAFIFACIPVIVFYITLYTRARTDEKEPIAALLAVMAVSVMFWAVFKQNGTALTTWAEYYTNKNIPENIQPAMKSLHWSKTIPYVQDSTDQFDANFNLIKENGKPVKGWGYDVYFRNLPESDKPAEGGSVSVFNSELFQSINPFFVVVLSPLVVLFFTFLKRRNREPHVPTKIAWGLVISALSTLVMVAAVMFCHNGLEKASLWWLFGTYGVITIGELFLSPMGLSLVSKLSPKNITALMMGGWFLSTSIGNKLSGMLASMWDGYSDKSYFFLLNFALLMGSAVMIFAMLKWLNRIFIRYVE